jgi:hypothetical protein
MAEKFYPFDAGAGSQITEIQWAEMAQYWRSSGVLPDDQTKAQDNDFNGEFAISTSSSTKNVTIGPGAAWIHGHYYKNDANLTKTLADNTSGYTRIDRLVIRLDWVNNTISLEIKQGTPSGSPQPPALSQTFGSIWEIPLYQISCPNGFANSAACTYYDERLYSDSVGARIMASLYRDEATDTDQSLAGGTWNVVNFTYKKETVDNMGDLTSDKIIVPQKGIYLVTAQARVNIASADFHIMRTRNGNPQTVNNAETVARQSGVAAASMAALVECNAWDYFWLAIYVSSGTTSLEYGNNIPRLDVIRVGDIY